MPMTGRSSCRRGKIQRTGVRSEPAEPRVIRTAIRALGTIQLDERRLSVISMRSESWVQKVTNVTTGTRVTKGQPLMEIYSPSISSAAAEYIATINSRTTGSSVAYGRGSRQRLQNLDVPEAVIAAMEKSGNVPIAIEWSAPRDGVVLERNAIEGMRAQPGDVLFRVADTSVVWAVIDVAERDLGALQVGQPVVVRARSYPGREFAGQISVIYPQVNKDTRTRAAADRIAQSGFRPAAGHVCRCRNRQRQSAGRARRSRERRAGYRNPPGGVHRQGRGPV